MTRHPCTHLALLTFASAVTVAGGACADLPDDPNSTEDELASATGDEVPTLLAQTCSPRQCNATRVPEGYQAIHAKLDTLHPDLRAQYYASAASDVGTTPDGLAHYKWFAGYAGRGAIYTVNGNGTRVIYGAVLDAWQQAGFERGHLRYMWNDPEIDLTAPAADHNYERRQEFQQDQYLPGPDNGGLQRVRHFLVPDAGRVQEVEQREYLDSAHPTLPATEPQECELLPSDMIPKYAMGRWEGLDLVMWCGPKYWREDGYEHPFDDGLI